MNVQRTAQSPIVGAGSLLLLILLSSASAPPPKQRLECGAGFIAAREDRAPSDPDHVRRLEVYQNTLAEVPLAVGLTLSLHDDSEVKSVALARVQKRWVDFFALEIRKDNVPLQNARLVLLEGSDRIVPPRVSSGNDGRRADEALYPGESAQCTWRLLHDGAGSLELGIYEVVVTPLEGSEDFFRLPVLARLAPPLRLKELVPGEEERLTEDSIERLSLWGQWLHEFDKRGSKKAFTRAWELLNEYEKRGFGDEPDLYNITPRWQASVVAGWLDRPRDEISNLSNLLSSDATAAANGKECKMRYYHFGLERGHLPRNMDNDLVLKLNNLYESFYGRRMNGRQGTPLRPWPKKFEDSPDPTLKIDESMPKNPE